MTQDKIVTVPELRKAAKCIYIAVEEPVADDIARLLNGAADSIEELCRQIDGTVRVGAAALARIKELESK